MTLPLIVAMRNGSPQQASTVRQAILTGEVADIDNLLKTVKATGGLQYTEALAVAEIDKATACLEKLPSSVYRDAMHDLARYSINREY